MPQELRKDFGRPQTTYPGILKRLDEMTSEDRIDERLNRGNELLEEERFFRGLDEIKKMPGLSKELRDLLTKNYVRSWRESWKNLLGEERRRLEGKRKFKADYGEEKSVINILSQGR